MRYILSARRDRLVRLQSLRRLVDFPYPVDQSLERFGTRSLGRRAWTIDDDDDYGSCCRILPLGVLGPHELLFVESRIKTGQRHSAITLFVQVIAVTLLPAALIFLILLLNEEQLVGRFKNTKRQNATAGTIVVVIINIVHALRPRTCSLEIWLEP